MQRCKLSVLDIYPVIYSIFGILYI